MCLGDELQGVLIQASKAARPYLFSDGQNMHNRVVLVRTMCTTRCLSPKANSQVPGTTGTLGDFWPLRLVWQLTK
jgi:hypothetical protein